MRTLITISSLLALSACMSEAGFEKKSLANCEEAACADMDCNAGSDIEIPDTCEFDAKAAKDCIKGEWTCSGDEGFDYVVAPDACLDVYVCGEVEGTGTGTGTGGT